MKRAFTLMEVIAVLVIIAVIALIAVPIVNSIIDKTEKSSYKRSVDRYAHAIENAIMTYKMEHGRYATELSELNIEYSGYKVKCNDIELNKNGTVYLNKCYVNNNKVKDNKTKDGWYHYGKVQYEYNVGDIITYKNITYYVIKPSKPAESYLTLLKSEPLTYDEVYNYPIGTYVVNRNNYGNIGYVESNYSSSRVKAALDYWAQEKVDINDLEDDDLGYKVRLITEAELRNNLGYDNSNEASEAVPNFVYDNKYYYWTMSSQSDYEYNKMIVWDDGSIRYSDVYNYRAIRPVINLKKEVIGGVS